VSIGRVSVLCSVPGSTSRSSSQNCGLTLAPRTYFLLKPFPIVELPVRRAGNVNPGLRGHPQNDLGVPAFWAARSGALDAVDEAQPGTGVEGLVQFVAEGGDSPAAPRGGEPLYPYVELVADDFYVSRGPEPAMPRPAAGWRGRRTPVLPRPAARPWPPGARRDGARGGPAAPVPLPSGRCFPALPARNGSSPRKARDTELRLTPQASATSAIERPGCSDLLPLVLGELGRTFRAFRLEAELMGTAPLVVPAPAPRRVRADPEARCHVGPCRRPGLDQLHSSEPPSHHVAALPAPGRHAPQHHDPARLVLDQVHAIGHPHRPGSVQRQRASSSHGDQSSTPKHLGYRHTPIIAFGPP
jgi:hypothetical protein